VNAWGSELKYSRPVAAWATQDGWRRVADSPLQPASSYKPPSSYMPPIRAGCAVMSLRHFGDHAFRRTDRRGEADPAARGLRLPLIRDQRLQVEVEGGPPRRGHAVAEPVRERDDDEGAVAEEQTHGGAHGPHPEGDVRVRRCVGGRWQRGRWEEWKIIIREKRHTKPAVRSFRGGVPRASHRAARRGVRYRNLAAWLSELDGRAATADDSAKSRLPLIRPSSTGHKLRTM